MEYKKLYEKATVEKASKFSKLAEYVVDNYCSELDGTKLIGDHRTNIIDTLSCDLSLGALYERNRLIKVGIPVGILAIGLGTIVGIKIGRSQVTRTTVNKKEQ